TDPVTAADQGPPAVCSDADLTTSGVQDVITVGAVTYSPATSTTLVYTETNTRQINAAGAAATCSGTTLTIPSAAGGANTGDIKLPVVFTNAGAPVAFTGS